MSGAPPVAAICATCGTQYAAAAAPPDACVICADERQFVPPAGQEWTSHELLRRERRNTVERFDERLIALSIDPIFAIGQRAWLIGTDDGNVLWDCLPLLDEAVYQLILASGGLQAMVISHPHFYGAMAEWSSAFGNVPVYLHADDRVWAQREFEAIVAWEGERLELPGGLTAIRCGGHFAGSSVLHWPQGAEGAGALFTADTIQVVPDTGWVSFMYSYPNLIPLSASTVDRIVAAVDPFPYECIYGAFRDVIERDGQAIVRRSAERYRAALADAGPATG